MAQPASYKEQYRVTHYQTVPVRNRAEGHLVEYAKGLLAAPTALTVHEVWDNLEAERMRVAAAHPSWGNCRLSKVQTTGTVKGSYHLIQRGFAIMGPQRGTYTVMISETVMKNITLDCWPVCAEVYPFGQPAAAPATPATEGAQSL